MVKRIITFIITLVVVFSFSSLLSADDGQKQKRTSPGIDETVDVDEFPSPIKQTYPKYPPEAKAQGVTGMVHVKVLIGTDGVPKDARVIKSQAAILDTAAMECALQWRFKPGTLKGEPVEVWVVIPFKFALTKDKETPKNKE